MARYAARTDGNQRRLVELLRAVGCVVEVISDVGRGVPDLLILYRGRILLAEVKDERQPPSRQALTAAERAFHLAWEGAPIYIINSDETTMAMLADSQHAPAGPGKATK